MLEVARYEDKARGLIVIRWTNPAARLDVVKEYLHGTCTYHTRHTCSQYGANQSYYSRINRGKK